jgi:Domain of unknown function (DUF1877)
MAVTLQVARITPAQLSECRRSVDVLDRLCSFTLVPASDHLDLDWAYGGLVRMCEHAGAALAVRRAMTGDDEVNPAYRDRPDTVMEQPRALEPPAVAALSAALHAVDLEEALAALPAGDPRAYLGGHFTALRAFYATAADRRLATVIWCD